MTAFIEELIPHRQPMRWIISLDECSETTAVASARFGMDDFAVENGVVLEPALVECIAQTVAAAMGQRARTRGVEGSPSAGMLIAASSFKIHSRPLADQQLRIAIREVKRMGPMLMIAGEISCNDALIANGELSLYA